MPIEDIIKELLSSASQERGQLKTVLLWTIFVIGINTIATIWNTITQFRLKEKDKDIANYNLKQAKRIKIHEEIFTKFNELSNFMPNSDINDLIFKIQNTQRFIEVNKLYINKTSISLYNEFLDYFKQLIITPNKKDVKQESLLTSKLVDNFEKI